MIRRDLARLAAALLIIFVLNIGDLVELRRNVLDLELALENDIDAFDKAFSELLFGFHRVDTGLNAADLSQLAFLAVPPLFFGQSISADLSISGTYYFTRQNNRTAWYFKRSLSLLLLSLITALFTCGLNTALTLQLDVGRVPVPRVLLVACSVTLCIFTLVMLSNLAGIYFGSVIGLAAAVVFAAVNILLTATPARSASIVFSCTFLPDEAYREMAAKLAVNGAYAAAAFAVGHLVIKKRELGLVNAEHLF